MLHQTEFPALKGCESFGTCSPLNSLVAGAVFIIIIDGIYLLIYSSICSFFALFAHQYRHTYMHACMHACMHAYIHSVIIKQYILLRCCVFYIPQSVLCILYSLVNLYFRFSVLDSVFSAGYSILCVLHCPTLYNTNLYSLCCVLDDMHNIRLVLKA